MTALILMGVAPSFAEEKAYNNNENNVRNVKTVPAADINWKDGPSIEGTSGIIIDAGSGEVLYEKNPHEKRNPASITKIITCLIAIENLDMNRQITAPIDANPEGTNIKLKKGEVLTVEQLLYATLLQSGNDAADTLAITMGGSIENFAVMMNERAAECGAKNTSFSNASGLNEEGQPPHYTTAYDIAMIAKEAMKNPTFRKIVGTAKYTIPATNMSKERVLKTSNAFLYGKEKKAKVNGVEKPVKYKGVTGVKTGYTSIAGDCFCGSAVRGDTELIAVVLNSTSTAQRFGDVMALWDYGFSKYYTYVAEKSGKIIDDFRLWQGEKSKVNVGISEDMDITLNKGYDNSLITLEVVKADGMLKAPIQRGQTLGTLVAYNADEEPIAYSELIALENVEKGGILSYIGIADENLGGFVISIVILIIILIIIRIMIVKSRRKKKQRRRAARNRYVRRKEWEREKNPFDN